jgi:hypothetical protein
MTQASGGAAGSTQAADVLLDADEDDPDVEVLDDDVLPLSEDLLSELPALLVAGALPDDELRLSVR